MHWEPAAARVAPWGPPFALGPAPPSLSRLPIGLPPQDRVQSQRFAPNLNRCFHLNRANAAGGFPRRRRQRQAPRGRSWARHPVSGEGDGGGSGDCDRSGGGRGPAG